MAYNRDIVTLNFYQCVAALNERDGRLPSSKLRSDKTNQVTNTLNQKKKLVHGDSTITHLTSKSPPQTAYKKQNNIIAKRQAPSSQQSVHIMMAG
jgi:hypothetical protein